MKIGLIGSNQIQHIKELLDKEYDVIDIQSSINSSNKFLKMINFLGKISEVDIVYNVFTEKTFYKKVLIFKLLNKKVITHWIGTDAYNLMIGQMNPKLLKHINVHLACSQNIKDELLKKNIESTVLPIFPQKMNLDICSMPDYHSILVYMPEGKEDFYGYKIISKIIDKYKDISFYFVANNDRRKFPQKNVILKGYIPINEMELLYEKISIVLRMPKHDGLSMSVIEGLAKGKYVIWNHNHPFILYADNYDSVCKMIDEVLLTSPTVNYESHKYIISNYNREKFSDSFKDILARLNND